MGYRSTDDAVAVLIMLGTVIYGLVVLENLIGHWFWWALAAIIALYVSYIAYVRKKKERMACRHGTIGAFYGRITCVQCIAETDAKNKADEERRKEEEEAKRVKRQKSYNEHIRKIRLPSYLKDMNPLAFERLACDLHAKLGYEVESTVYSGDNGADGILKRNGELTILQAKRVQGYVGEPVLRDLFGTMHSFGAKHGVVVTTGKVSEQARKWVLGKSIRIIELEELSSLIRQNFKEGDLVPDSFAPSIKHVNLCPECHRPLRKRRGKHGSFWGCTGYPSCRYTKNI